MHEVFTVFYPQQNFSHPYPRCEYVYINICKYTRENSSPPADHNISSPISMCINVSILYRELLRGLSQILQYPRGVPKSQEEYRNCALYNTASLEKEISVSSFVWERTIAIKRKTATGENRLGVGISRGWLWRLVTAVGFRGWRRLKPHPLGVGRKTRKTTRPPCFSPIESIKVEKFWY